MKASMASPQLASQFLSSTVCSAKYQRLIHRPYPLHGLFIFFCLLFFLVMFFMGARYGGHLDRLYYFDASALAYELEEHGEEVAVSGKVGVSRRRRRRGRDTYRGPHRRTMMAVHATWLGFYMINLGTVLMGDAAMAPVCTCVHLGTAPGVPKCIKPIIMLGCCILTVLALMVPFIPTDLWHQLSICYWRFTPFAVLINIVFADHMMNDVDWQIGWGIPVVMVIGYLLRCRIADFAFMGISLVLLTLCFIGRTRPPAASVAVSIAASLISYVLCLAVLILMDRWRRARDRMAASTSNHDPSAQQPRWGRFWSKTNHPLMLSVGVFSFLMTHTAMGQTLNRFLLQHSGHDTLAILLVVLAAAVMATYGNEMDRELVGDPALLDRGRGWGVIPELRELRGGGPGEGGGVGGVGGPAAELGESTGIRTVGMSMETTPVAEFEALYDRHVLEIRIGRTGVALRWILATRVLSVMLVVLIHGRNGLTDHRIAAPLLGLVLAAFATTGCAPRGHTIGGESLYVRLCNLCRSLQPLHFVVLLVVKILRGGDGTVWDRFALLHEPYYVDIFCAEMVGDVCVASMLELPFADVLLMVLASLARFSGITYPTHNFAQRIVGVTAVHLLILIGYLARARGRYRVATASNMQRRDAAMVAQWASM